MSAAPAWLPRTLLTGSWTWAEITTMRTIALARHWG